MTLVKAELVSTDGDITIPFMFNPNELSFTRAIKINSGEGSFTREGFSKISFSHPEPRELEIKGLILDTYEKGNGESVLTHLKPFEDALYFAKNGGGKNQRPPTFLLCWGDLQYIRCFIQEISYTLTMFLPDGTPVRAKLDLTLMEIGRATKSGDTAPRASRRTDNRSTRS